ncbi:uncharacterized protein isoform X5 [Leptinotarsa decemlineata]|uniref:uncharacterized protein isoform X5 n=1 Tax=Leptinotarsa decemlineata TaxID=7539 RepID=UPI003D309359
MEDKNVIPEIVRVDIKTEIVKEEPIEAEDSFVECETCKENSTSEKDCAHRPSDRLGLPRGECRTNVSDPVEDVKPKVEPDDRESLSDDLIDKLIESGVTEKEENYHDVPEILPEDTDFLRTEIKMEEVDIDSVKDELDNNEASISSEALGQEEDSNENPKPGPSEEAKKDKVIHGLKRHKKAYIEKKPHECQVCLKSFPSKSSLTVHFRIHSGEKPYKCKICPNAYTSRTSLVVHSRTHTGEKPFECQVCSRPFACRSALVVHSRIHTGEKPYKCKACSKSFSDNSSYIRHITVHEKEKQHKCEVCSKSYTDKSYLVVHSRIHTGEKPFKCEVCPNAYARYPSLVHHSRIHTGERPYQCKFCSKPFISQNGLSRHEKIHEGKTLEMPSLYKIVSPSKLRPVVFTVTESSQLVQVTKTSE